MGQGLTGAWEVARSGTVAWRAPYNAAAPTAPRRCLEVRWVRVRGRGCSYGFAPQTAGHHT